MSREVFMKHRAISGFGNINITTQKFYLISCSIVLYIADILKVIGKLKITGHDNYSAF